MGNLRIFVSPLVFAADADTQDSAGSGLRVSGGRIDQALGAVASETVDHDNDRRDSDYCTKQKRDHYENPDHDNDGHLSRLLVGLSGWRIPNTNGYGDGAVLHRAKAARCRVVAVSRGLVADLRSDEAGDSVDLSLRFAICTAWRKDHHV